LLKRRRADVVASAGSPTAQAYENAPALLLSLNLVRSPSGSEGLLRRKDVGSGGWCFFLALFDQLGSVAIPDCRYLAVLALVAMADRRDEFEASVPGVDFLGAELPEVRQARAALREVDVYQRLGVVELLTPFQCGVLGKLEGVLRGDLLEGRRYADDNEIQVLLQPCGLEALVLESNDASVDAAAARSRVYPSWDRVGPGVVAKLAAGELDLVVVRYELGSYQHYESVAFEDGRPWRVAAAKRELLERRFLACEVCQAVASNEADVARTLVLTMLGGVCASLGGSARSRGQ
jgi:hypothetical protein